jgi:ABC-type lipoprotein release transport system permease subunit
VQRLAAGRHDLLPERRLAALAAIDGVTSATGRLWGYTWDEDVRANYTVLVPEGFEAEPGSAVVGAGIARLRGLKPGGRMFVRAYDGEPVELAVSDVLPAESELVATDVVAVTAVDFRRIFGFDADVFTDAAVRVANPAEVRTVAAKVVAAMPDVRAITRDDIARTYEAVFDWRGGLAVLVLAGAVLAFAVVAWDKASGLSAGERREIGVLKAVGWDTADVLLMKAWEGAAVSLTAFAAGGLAAWVHVFHTSAPLLRAVLQGWSGLYPDFRPAPHVTPFELVNLFLLAVVPYVLATLVPAWRAATADPDAAMRS